MAFELPALPYPHEALEPHIDTRTMQIHHGKHHQAYVTNLNKALESAPEWAEKSIEEIVTNLDKLPEAIRMAVRNNGGGHANHSFFWQIMGPGMGGAPAGALAEAITTTFGSFDARTANLSSNLNWFISDKQELRVKPDFGGAVPKIDDAPWPAFPPDLMSIALVTATQAQGTVIVHEKMYDGRLFFVDKLIAMGAQIILCDPHRAVVVGPRQLVGQQVSSPDIRAGMALVLAALVAEGTTTIGNVRQIDRGYERIDEKLRQLGAHIERVERD